MSLTKHLVNTRPSLLKVPAPPHSHSGDQGSSMRGCSQTRSKLSAQVSPSQSGRSTCGSQGTPAHRGTERHLSLHMAWASMPDSGPITGQALQILSFEQLEMLCWGNPVPTVRLASASWPHLSISSIFSRVMNSLLDEGCRYTEGLRGNRVPFQPAAC